MLREKYCYLLGITFGMFCFDNDDLGTSCRLHILLLADVNPFDITDSDGMPVELMLENDLAFRYNKFPVTNAVKQ